MSSNPEIKSFTRWITEKRPKAGGDRSLWPLGLWLAAIVWALFQWH